MISTQHIVERGAWTSMVAPELAFADRAARLARVDEVLGALSPVYRPLALEVDLCWREPATGLPAVHAADAPVHLLALAGAQRHAVLRPTLIGPPPVRSVPALDGAAIATCTAGLDAPAPGLLLDWRELRSVASAARMVAPVSAVRLEELGRELAPYEPFWFAGPVGDRGYEVWPPGVLTLSAEERVRFRLVMHWSAWTRADTPECALLEAAFSHLRAAGWQMEEHERHA